MCAHLKYYKLPQNKTLEDIRSFCALLFSERIQQRQLVLQKVHGKWNKSLSLGWVFGQVLPVGMPPLHTELLGLEIQ